MVLVPGILTQCFDVMIFDDDIPEETEFFGISLSPMSPNVTVQPSVVVVSITDNDIDGKKHACTVVFNNHLYCAGPPRPLLGECERTPH